MHNGIYWLNKYGLFELNYLKKYKKCLYMTLLIENELMNHLVSVSNESQNKVDFLIENYKKIDKLPEKGKENNQLKSVTHSNNFKNIT